MDFIAARTDSAPCNASESVRPRYRFADCFSGLGGFRVGLERLGHTCVFASEIDEPLRQLYKRNFGTLPAGDIRLVRAADVPPHDILCAGFPCQPFSLAGKKQGALCPESGKLIDDVFRLVRHHQQKYVFLENVPNVLTIADGAFWGSIVDRFTRLGYRVEYRLYSALEFGVPQQRQRLFAIARRSDMPAFSWPDPKDIVVPSLGDFLQVIDSGPFLEIEPAKLQALEKWEEYVRKFPPTTSHTILAAEFGATYPLDGIPKGRPWREYRGAYGQRLASQPDREAAMQLLPHYAADNGGRVPQWLRPYVLTSRALYAQSKRWCNGWKKGMEDFHNSWQKLDWRGDRSKPSLWAHTLQFRASGIRVMRSELAPSLVAMTTTQTPILGAKRRYMTVREAASLQSLQDLKAFPDTKGPAFRALGNAVNAQIVEEVARAALS